MMGDSKRKYDELVKEGKINPNEPIKRFPLLEESEIRQIAYEAGLWAIDIAQFQYLLGNPKPASIIFKEKFDSWIKNRINLNKYKK